MTTLRTAAQTVLREWDAGMKGWPLDEAITALRAALAQEAEPVASCGWEDCPHGADCVHAKTRGCDD